MAKAFVTCNICGGPYASDCNCRNYWSTAGGPHFGYKHQYRGTNWPTEPIGSYIPYNFIPNLESRTGDYIPNSLDLKNLKIKELELTIRELNLKIRELNLKIRELNLKIKDLEEIDIKHLKDLIQEKNYKISELEKHF